MKRFYFLRTLVSAFLVMTFCAAYGQTTDTVTITLMVDTDSLGTDSNAPGGCSFSANPPSIVIVDNGDPKAFTVEIPLGTTVIWEGITQEEEEVKIKKIGYLRGMNIFNSVNIPGRINNGREKVEARTVRATPSEMDYTYQIEFKVPGIGRYTLDPKIRVK